jgi:hypothetical protein
MTPKLEQFHSADTLFPPARIRAAEDVEVGQETSLSEPAITITEDVEVGQEASMPEPAITITEDVVVLAP